MQMQNPNAQAKMQQVYANSMRQQMQNAMDSNGQKGMPNPQGLPQGSPALDGNGEFFNANNIRSLQQSGAPNNNSNHALQDYQMQLMLLEQQNKKRLLMARQEQDATVANGTGGAMPGQQAFGAPAMSPSNSRTGPSPNPEDMKRGTPKMAPSGMPQPGMEGMQGRGSPAPGFDPNQMNPNMPPGFQGMKMPGGMMPNGQMMPAATSHPAFNAQMNGQMTPQQMEMMRQQAGRPNGPWPQGPPPGMMQPQQPPNMTPRNSNMPPPPAPATGEGQNRTQPSSPSQANAAPPTPSQSNKPNPKGKKETGKGNKVSPGTIECVSQFANFQSESLRKEGSHHRCHSGIGSRRSATYAYTSPANHTDRATATIQKRPTRRSATTAWPTECGRQPRPTRSCRRSIRWLSRRWRRECSNICYCAM